MDVNSLGPDNTPTTPTITTPTVLLTSLLQTAINEYVARIDVVSTGGMYGSSATVILTSGDVRTIHQHFKVLTIPQHARKVWNLFAVEYHTYFASPPAPKPPSGDIEPAKFDAWDKEMREFHEKCDKNWAAHPFLTYLVLATNEISRAYTTDVKPHPVKTIAEIIEPEKYKSYDDLEADNPYNGTLRDQALCKYCQ